MTYVWKLVLACFTSVVLLMKICFREFLQPGISHPSGNIADWTRLNH